MYPTTSPRPDAAAPHVTHDMFCECPDVCAVHAVPLLDVEIAPESPTATNKPRSDDQNTSFIDVVARAVHVCPSDDDWMVDTPTATNKLSDGDQSTPNRLVVVAESYFVHDVPSLEETPTSPEPPTATHFPSDGA